MKGFIYKIVSKETGKFYIGSTANKKSRFRKHVLDLKRRKHHSFLLQEEFDKYGLNNFSFVLIEECDNLKLRDKEQKYIDSYDFNILLNVSKTSTCGDLLSYHPKKDEIITKMKNSLNKTISEMSNDVREKTYSRPMEKNPNWKGGKTYCKCGSKKNMYADYCIKCTDKSGKNNSFFGKKHSKESRLKISNSLKGKPSVCRIKVSIENVTYNSFTEAAKDIGCSVATIRNRLNRNVKGYKLIKA